MSEDQLTRPVEGFLTNSGVFFPTEREAQTYEAVGAFNDAFTAYFDKHMIGGVLKEFLMDNMRYFILAEREVMLNYLSMVDTVPEEPPIEDIRATGPVAPEPIRSLELSDDDVQTAFVQAFSDTLGEDDPPPEETGGTTQI